MKKTIWIFSLSVLLFSTLAPSFTYATWDVINEPVIDENVIDNVTITNEIFWEKLWNEVNDVEWENLENDEINVDLENIENQWNLSLWFTPYNPSDHSSEILETEAEYLDRCYVYTVETNWLNLEHYKYEVCGSNVIIPKMDWKKTYIDEETFAWTTIDNLDLPSDTALTINSKWFSWAVINTGFTIEWDITWNYPEWFTIWENWVVRFNKQIIQMYDVNVNWRLIYDLNPLMQEYNIPYMSVSEFLCTSRINGVVDIIWFTWEISNSFKSSEITSNWVINIWEWIDKIHSYSFGWESYEGIPSIMDWIINLPNSLNLIQNSFNKSEINWSINFPESLKTLASSFNNSNVNSDMIFESNSQDNDFEIDSSFDYSYLWSNLMFSWLNVDLNNVSPYWISWDLSFYNLTFTELYNLFTLGGETILWSINFINTDLYLDWWYFFSGTKIWWDFNISWDSLRLSSNIPVDLKIWGNLNITWNNLIMPWFGGSEITWNVSINAWTMNLQYWLNGSKINWNVSIIADVISAKYGALNNLNISWDYLMSWNVLDLEDDVLNDLNIDWDFEIKWWLLKAKYGVLNDLNIYWDIKLPNNSEFWPGTLWWVIAKWNYIISYDTTVSIWDSVNNAQLSNDVKIVADEIESSEINANDDKIVIQNSEIVATSWMVVEYEWWLKVNFQDNWSSDIEWTAKFSDPIAVKVPVKNINNNFVKVMVKHQWDEDFWFTGLTLSQENVCDDWIPTSNPYNWEDVAVEENNDERYAVIYTCSASTFVAYTENEKKIENNTNENVSNNTSSSLVWGWSTISVKSNTTVKEQEHNSADTEKTTEKENNSIQPSNKTETTSVEQKVRMVWWKSLTRWEVAVMTNILLDVYPQLTENKTLNEVSEACENYADEQNFTKDEKKAITRLCKLSIMWIHRDTKEALDEFMVKQMASNDEFATVMDRAVENYTEKDLSVVKEALKKLENNEENVVFGTVYDVFMSIKNIFG